MAIRAALLQPLRRLTMNKQLFFILVAFVLLLMGWRSFLLPTHVPVPPSKPVTGYSKPIEQESETPEDSHPIRKLHEKAKQEFNNTLTRQSRTYDEAFDAYKIRYGRPPPDGFKGWYDMAASYESPIIDDYDEIMAHLRPFRSYLVNKCDLYNFTQNELESKNLVQICFENGTAKITNGEITWMKDALQEIVIPFQQNLPDLCVLINPNDESRSMLPRHFLLPNFGLSSDHCHDLSFVDLSKQDTWSIATMSCQFDTPARARPFSTNATNCWYKSEFEDITDLCAHQRNTPYGLLVSSASFSVTHDLVPVLSSARLSTFADVLMPSLSRYSNHMPSDPISERGWETKTAKLFWRGATHGGWATSTTFPHLHRQHLLKSLTDLSNPAIDVAFTSVTQCSEIACNSQRQLFPIDPPTSSNMTYTHKYVLDIDADGASPSLYDALRSNSLVLRYTMLREWHDARLKPWVHFVPLSGDANEVADMLEYFESKEGFFVAKNIAEEGRRWAGQALRPVDQMLYLYRLFVEMSDGRRRAGEEEEGEKEKSY